MLLRRPSSLVPFWCLIVVIFNPPSLLVTTTTTTTTMSTTMMMSVVWLGMASASSIGESGNDDDDDNNSRQWRRRYESFVLDRRLLEISKRAIVFSETVYDRPPHDIDTEAPGALYREDGIDAVMLYYNETSRTCFEVFRATTPRVTDWIQNLKIGLKRMCTPKMPTTTTTIDSSDDDGNGNGNDEQSQSQETMGIHNITTNGTRTSNTTTTNTQDEDDDADCCMVREGFYDAYFLPNYYQEMNDAARRCLLDCQEASSSSSSSSSPTSDDECSLVVTGSSQGAAIAAVAGLDMADIDPIVITFGQPPTIIDEHCPLANRLTTFVRYQNSIVISEDDGGDGRFRYDLVPNLLDRDVDRYGTFVLLSEDRHNVKVYKNRHELPFIPTIRQTELTTTAAHRIPLYQERILHLEPSSKSSSSSNGGSAEDVDLDHHGGGGGGGGVVGIDGFDLGVPCYQDHECRSRACHRERCFDVGVRLDESLLKTVKRAAVLSDAVYRDDATRRNVAPDSIYFGDDGGNSEGALFVFDEEDEDEDEDDAMAGTVTGGGTCYAVFRGTTFLSIAAWIAGLKQDVTDACWVNITDTDPPSTIPTVMPSHSPSAMPSTIPSAVPSVSPSILGVAETSSPIGPSTPGSLPPSSSAMPSADRPDAAAGRTATPTTPMPTIDPAYCCQVRKGFHDSFVLPPHVKELEDQIRSCRAQCGHGNGDGDGDDGDGNGSGGCDVVIAGHSRGGAIATIAGIHWADLDPTIITFGEPPSVIDDDCDSDDATVRPVRLLDSDRVYRFINSELVRSGSRTTFEYDPVHDLLGRQSDQNGRFLLLGDDPHNVKVYFPDEDPLSIVRTPRNYNIHRMGSYLDRIQSLSLTRKMTTTAAAEGDDDDDDDEEPQPQEKEVTLDAIGISGFDVGYPCGQDSECRLDRCLAHCCVTYDVTLSPVPSVSLAPSMTSAPTLEPSSSSSSPLPTNSESYSMTPSQSSSPSLRPFQSPTAPPTTNTEEEEEEEPTSDGGCGPPPRRLFPLLRTNGILLIVPLAASLYFGQ